MSPLSPTPTNLRPDLRHSWLDGVLYAAMVGAGETYFPAFVLASGHGELAAGLVATLPMLAGAIVQLGTPRAVASLGSHRRWVVLCATMQAVAFVPLVVGAFVGHMPVVPIFLAAALYWAAGLAAAPAWNAWITGLVPQRIHARYFALRTRAMHAATLAGLVLGGLALQQLALGNATRTFALLFLAAALARLGSARHLARHSEPRRPEARPLPWRDVLRSPALRSARRLIAYLLCLQVAVQVAAPYYSPYMLKELGLSYGTYMLLIASAFVAKMAALPLLGHWARRVGSRRLAWVGTCGIVLASLPWYATTHVGLLLAAQLVAGVFWAAFELASLLLLFEHIPERERTSVITLYNLGNSACFALGSLIGGAILQGLGAGAGAYGTLFLLTSALRALTLLLLRPVEHGAGPAPALPHLHPSAVRPSLGSIEVPEPGGVDSPARPGSGSGAR